MSADEKTKGSSITWSTLWVVLFVIGTVAWALTVTGADPMRAWRSLLINFLFFTSLAGGLVVWPPIVRTCNGKWQLGLERLALAAAPFAIPSLLALVLLWIGSPNWAPWRGGSYHQGVWLDNTFIFCRDIASLLLFWGLVAYYLRERHRGRGERCGTILILVYTLVFSLLGFDLVMALDPEWHSNLAGGYFFMSGLYIGMTGWAFLASWQEGAEPDQLQDLGRLIVAFSLMTTYLMYAHLLLMWYENLPKEIRFLVPRMHNPQWTWISYILLGIVYFGPLVLLLTQKAKRVRGALGAISLLVLVGMWLERWWLIAPTFDPLLRLGVSEISLAAAFTGLLGLGMVQSRRFLPEERPVDEKKP